ncbi:MAG: cytoplasmic iron level regulating protein YaaA (DUF328/UPF0246 family) [Saprospiraceae bacterium]|jgi:cytoplasmic iron level regulating protein YaaA (DUF328/UPF0246 family)
MILLLSPAKSLNLEPLNTKSHTLPRLLEESQALIDVLKKKSAKKIKELMSVSDNIAALNVDRFNNFQTPFTTENSKPAALIFDGDVYSGLQADTFDQEDMQFAQKHLRILSGLYGLLRPLDLMQAYRLEMGTSLKNGRKKNLYQFWDNKITNILNEDLKESGSDIVLNLASKEYFSAVKTAKLNGTVVTIEFKENRNGIFKVISFNAKKARGTMANKIIKNKITDTSKLKRLSIDGYKYNKDLSENHKLVFTK